MQTHKLVKLMLTSAALSSVMLASATTMSGAADVAPQGYNAPPYFLWTGLYAGAHVGAGWSDGASGFIGGGQVGYNYQINHWVLGLEGDLSGTTIGSSTSVDAGMGVTGSASGGIDWIATLAPRVGYAFDHWLVYGKVGAAWVHGSATASVAFMGSTVDSVSVQSTSSGAVFGVGAEYALGKNWSAKAEYDVFNFGNNSGNFQTLKAGVNYRFGGF